MCCCCCAAAAVLRGWVYFLVVVYSGPLFRNLHVCSCTLGPNLLAKQPQTSSSILPPAQHAMKDPWPTQNSLTSMLRLVLFVEVEAHAQMFPVTAKIFFCGNIFLVKSAGQKVYFASAACDFGAACVCMYDDETDERKRVYSERSRQQAERTYWAFLHSAPVDFSSCPLRFV